MYFSFFFVSFVMTLVVVLLIVMMSYKGDKSEGFVSGYECGFDPVMGSRMNFSFRFFLISILFLIFDVEISLMLPLPYLSEYSLLMLSVSMFLMVLLVGLLYEYNNGVIKWLSNN